MIKREHDKLLKILYIIFCIVLLGFVIITSIKTSNSDRKKYSNLGKVSIKLSLNKDNIIVKLPEEKNLFDKETSIVTYKTDKDLDGNDIEIYKQNGLYKQIDQSNLNKISLTLSDETIFTFELYKIKDKNPLNVLSQTKSFKYKDKEIIYGGYQSGENTYDNYINVEISDKTSLVISLTTPDPLTKGNIKGILDWITF